MNFFGQAYSSGENKQAVKTCFPVVKTAGKNGRVPTELNCSRGGGGKRNRPIFIQCLRTDFRFHLIPVNFKATSMKISSLVSAVTSMTFGRSCRDKAR